MPTNPNAPAPAPGARPDAARIDLDRLYAAMDERSMDGYLAAWQTPAAPAPAPTPPPGLDRLRQRVAARRAGRRP